MPWLCSDHEKKNTKTKELYGRTKDVFEYFSLLLASCSCLLCALVQKKVKAFHCSMIRNPLNFPRITFWFSKQIIGRWSDSLSSVFYNGSNEARFFNQPECALYLNFIIIVSAVMTSMTQQKIGKQFWVNIYVFLVCTIVFLNKLAQYFTYMRPPCFFNCYVYHYRHHRYLHNNHQWPQPVISTGIV